MSAASSAASTSSLIMVSSGASGSSAAPTADSAPPDASSSSSGLYSHLLRSLDNLTRGQIEAAMARALLSSSAPLTTISGAASGMQRYALTFCHACKFELVCSKYPFIRSPLPFAASLLSIS